MADEKKVFLTAKGFTEIEEELDDLKKVKRPEIIKAIKEARALGDLSENAEYHSAREEQAIIEGRIQELEYMVEHAEIIEEVAGDKVKIGATVVIRYDGEDDTEEYKIVGSTEADPFLNNREFSLFCISNGSNFCSGFVFIYCNLGLFCSIF